VELNGQRIYLGRYDLPETRQKYHRTITEWLAAGRQLPVVQDGLTIVELISRFSEQAKTYYARPDGTLSPEVVCLREACKPLRAL
jgi:hypothetical protein